MFDKQLMLLKQFEHLFKQSKTTLHEKILPNIDEIIKNIEDLEVRHKTVRDDIKTDNSNLRSILSTTGPTIDKFKHKIEPMIQNLTQQVEWLKDFSVKLLQKDNNGLEKIVLKKWGYSSVPTIFDDRRRQFTDLGKRITTKIDEFLKYMYKEYSPICMDEKMDLLSLFSDISFRLRCLNKDVKYEMLFIRNFVTKEIDEILYSIQQEIFTIKEKQARKEIEQKESEARLMLLFQSKKDITIKKLEQDEIDARTIIKARMEEDKKAIEKTKAPLTCSSSSSAGGRSSSSTSSSLSFPSMSTPPMDPLLIPIVSSDDHQQRKRRRLLLQQQSEEQRRAEELRLQREREEYYYYSSTQQRYNYN